MNFSAAQQATTPHTLRLTLALASAGPGFTLPGSAKRKTLALALLHKEAMVPLFSHHLSGMCANNNGLRSWG
jgi:hypothetical protein